MCYPWLCPEYNYIQYYDRKALEPFLKKWTDKSAPLITIAHFGDSHVQPDVYPGEIRKRLQQVKGAAGFGMIFPFSTAKTYSMVDYKSIHTGIWSNSKSIEHHPSLPLGISGATSQTTDSNASFTIIFHDHVPKDYRKLKIFYKQYRNSYAMKISSGGRDTLIQPDSSGINRLPYIEIALKNIGNTIKVQLLKTKNDQKEFEFYGMSLESVVPKGVLLHCMGIGGAEYGSILWESLFDEQLPGIAPDLAILDFGTNDFLYNNKIPDDLEGKIIQIIKKVRTDAPHCTVLLTSTMDMNHRGQNISAGLKFSKLIRKISKEQNCPFYDWYWVSGGPKKMEVWHDNGLAQNDNIHLKSKGSILKGQLLADAIINTMAMMDTPEKPDSLIVTVPEINDTISDNTKILGHSEISERLSKSGYIIYKVKSGENLGAIASAHHVTAASIKKLNGMKSSKIIAGKMLKIPSKARTSNGKPKAKHKHRRRK